MPSSEVSAARQFGTAIDVRKAAIVKYVILLRSIFAVVAAARADLDFDAYCCWRLSSGSTVGGAALLPALAPPPSHLPCPGMPWRLLAPSLPCHGMAPPLHRWLLVAPPVMPFLSFPMTCPQGLTLPPLYCSLVTFFFRGNKLEVSWPQGQLSAVANRRNSG